MGGITDVDHRPGGRCIDYVVGGDITIVLSGRSALNFHALSFLKIHKYYITLEKLEYALIS